MRSPLYLTREFARRQTHRWQAARRWRDGPADPATVAPHEPVPYRCNICGTGNAAPLDALTREAMTCAHCGSNVRFRAMVYLVTREVLGAPALLPSLRPRRDIRGLGLSDAEAYAGPLARKFDYENTYFHRSPRLDITAPVAPAREGRYDFLIASDVFEHVAPPVARAFANARRLLKPGGKFIFTVPFEHEGEPLEHFPELHDWTLSEQSGRWTLTNVTRDGRRQTFDDLTFHGGPGSTLEMRVFSRASVARAFTDAGFVRVRYADDAYLPFGIHWPEPWSVPIVAYA